MTTGTLYSPPKIVLVGSSKSGKSCLAQRWVHNDYDNEYVQTLGADMAIKLDPSGYVNPFDFSKKPPYQVWAVSGAERYKVLVSQFLDEAHAIIVCFDMLDQNSFFESEFWIQEAKRINPAGMIILCGTKIDEADSLVIKPQDAQKKAVEWGVEFKSVSAKNRTNVNELFEYATTKIN